MNLLCPEAVCDGSGEPGREGLDAPGSPELQCLQRVDQLSSVRVWQSASMTGKVGTLTQQYRKAVLVVDDDPSMLKGMRRLLTSIGFVEVLRFAKRRESWRLAGCRVELDELPKLGCFVEIEGPSEEAIQAVREQLGLVDSESVTRGYPELLSAACGARHPLNFEF